jgi:hypothetical protein
MQSNLNEIVPENGHPGDILSLLSRHRQEQQAGCRRRVKRREEKEKGEKEKGE